MPTWPAQVRGAPAVVNSGWTPKRRPNHVGWDMLTPVGTPIQAVLPGRVRVADWKKGAGCTVWVDHSNLGFVDGLDTDGLSSLYFHLAGIAVDRGEFVDEGQVVAESGETGAARGPHLHFGVLVSADWLERHADELDPGDVKRAAKWPGYWLNPEVLLGAPPAPTEPLAALAVQLSALRGGVGAPKARKRGVFGDKAPPKYKIRKWCIWQGEQRAYELLIAGGAALALWHFARRR